MGKDILAGLSDITKAHFEIVEKRAVQMKVSCPGVAGLFKKLDDSLLDQFIRSYLPHFTGVVLPSMGRFAA